MHCPRTGFAASLSQVEQLGSADNGLAHCLGHSTDLIRGRRYVSESKGSPVHHPAATQFRAVIRESSYPKAIPPQGTRGWGGTMPPVGSAIRARSAGRSLPYKFATELFPGSALLTPELLTGRAAACADTAAAELRSGGAVSGSHCSVSGSTGSTNSGGIDLSSAGAGGGSVAAGAGWRASGADCGGG